MLVWYIDRGGFSLLLLLPLLLLLLLLLLHGWVSSRLYSISCFFLSWYYDRRRSRALGALFNELGKAREDPARQENIKRALTAVMQV